MKILQFYLKTTFTWVFTLFFLVFTFQKKSFHAIISKPNKNLIAQPVGVALVCFTLVSIHCAIKQIAMILHSVSQGYQQTN